MQQQLKSSAPFFKINFMQNEERSTRRAERNHFCFKQYLPFFPKKRLNSFEERVQGKAPWSSTREFNEISILLIKHLLFKDDQSVPLVGCGPSGSCPRARGRAEVTPRLVPGEKKQLSGLKIARSVCRVVPIFLCQSRNQSQNKQFQRTRHHLGHHPADQLFNQKIFLFTV